MVKSLLWVRLSPRSLKRLKAQLISRQLHICQACSLWTSWKRFDPCRRCAGIGSMLLGVSHLAPGSQHISEPKTIVTVNCVIFAFSESHCWQDLHTESVTEIMVLTHSVHTGLSFNLKDPLHFILFMSPIMSDLDYTDSYLCSLSRERCFHFPLLIGAISECWTLRFRYNLGRLY